jgi:WD40 repeat protein
MRYAHKIFFFGFLILLLGLPILGFPQELNSDPIGLGQALADQHKLPKFAFSPDGQILASVGKDGQITLWKVATDSKQALFSERANVAVTGLIFSPDGQILAGIDEDGRITLWDMANGQKRMTLSSRIGSGFTSAVFSPDDRTMASVGKDPWITLWDVASGQATQTLSAHADAVNGIAFSPNGILLASAGEDGQIKLWNMKSGQEYLSLAGTNNISVIGVAFSPDGKTLASVDQANRIVLWDVKTGQKRLTVAAPAGAGVTGMAWSPDGKTLASGGENAETILWDVVTGQKRFNLVGQPGDFIMKVVFSPDGEFLASIGRIGQILIWDASTGTLKQVLDGQTDCVFDPNGKLLASMNREGRITLWEIDSGTQYLVARSPTLAPESARSDQPGAAAEERDSSAKSSPSTTSSTANPAATPNEIARIPSLKGAGSASTLTNEKPRRDDRKGITALALSPDGTRVASAGEDSKVRLLNVGTGRSLLTISGHHAAVTGIAFSTDGKRLLSASRDTEVRSWDATTGKLSQVLRAHEQPIRTVAASPDGGFLASAGEETRIMLWDAKLGKLSKILNGHADFVNGLAFSPDGKLLASGSADARILLWDTVTGRLLHTLRGHSGAVNSIAFSSKAGLLASGGADSKIRIWNVATGQQVQVLQGHQGSVRAVAFSPDGQLLASAGEDTRILIWNISTGKLSKTLPGAAVINTLIFSRDGKSLLNGGEDNQITDWDVANGKKRKSILVPPGSARAPFPDKGSKIVVNSSSSTVAGQSADIAAMPKGILSRLLDWFIPSAEAAIPPAPGGPILVIASTSSTFRDYYPEILRNEGFNAFAVADISTVSATTLAGHDVAILTPAATLSPDQVAMLTTWVTAGGNLIAMRPAPQLASLLGLAAAGSPLSNGYLRVDTSQAPGNGIVNQTIQFHGAADRYTLNGATSVATLYTDANTTTSNPAVTLRSVGTSGGQAAAFTYDLATSIVQTRQGNPAWAAQERDGYTPIRSNDKFYGNAIGDPQPDWVDLNKVAIPQADEQQRLLANLIIEMNTDKKPLPRFWYFPNGKKAVVVMTGDDHANNGTAGRFDQFIAASPPGCSVVDWECVRGTSYIFPNFLLLNAQAAAYEAQGFEVGLHVNTNCGDFTPTQLANIYSDQIATFTNLYPSVPAPTTQRHHCIAWSDWVTGAKVQLTNGIRLDTSYYFWPPGWVQNRPGFFNGSAMPMRFADLDGTLIDVYHAATQMTDESGQQYPFTIETLLDRALGVEGYYGAFTINAHTDLAQIPESDAVLASASPRGVPIVSSRQMLNWLDFRNSSSFGSLAWSGNALSFTVVTGTGSQNVPANGLQVLLPIKSPAGLLDTVTRNNNPITFTNQTIKGVDYAAFTGVAGSYVATYAADATPPTVSATSPANNAIDVSQGTVVTVTFSEAIDSATINATTFELRNAGGTLVPATVSYNASTRTATLTPSTSLEPLTTFTATAKGGATDPRVKDLAGNALVADFAWSFTTAAQPCASAPCSAWSSSTIPGTPSVSDPNPVELGVKFRTDLDGFIAGIRFYQVNAGTYTGTLWSLGGQQLATGTVTATGSGWKQVAFSAPRGHRGQHGLCGLLPCAQRQLRRH